MNYRLGVLFILPFCLFFISGCVNENIPKDNNIDFKQEDGNYFLNNSRQIDSYVQLENDLNNLNLEFNKNTPVAAASTSTANILYELGINLCAVPKSDDLNENLQKEIDSGKIKSIGSAVEPNMETLINSNPSVVFISSAMPMPQAYSNLNNVILLPQDKYIDIFVDVECLTKYFNLEKGQEIFNNMVNTHLEATQIAEDDFKQVDAILLDHAYSKLSIATDDSYIGSLAEQLNIHNIYGNYSNVDLDISKEKIILDNPSTIIIYTKDDDGYEMLKNKYDNLDDDLKQLDAYKNNQIYILKSISLNVDMNSPDTLLELSETIYE